MAGHFHKVTGDRTSGNSLKLNQGRFKLDTRKNFLSKRVIREVLESPSLEMFKNHVDEDLSDVA